jgi:hypothetical protein
VFTFKQHIIRRLAVALGVVIVAWLLPAGCIQNDLPYPNIQANFTSFQAEYMLGAAQIDSINRIVNITLGEEADISAVRVTGFELSPAGAAVASELPAVIDLSESYAVTLELYRSYRWIIKATQTIERTFSISGQVGASVIDVPGRRVIAYVPSGTDLTKIHVDSVKLGSVNEFMAPNLNGRTVDFSSPIRVAVTDYDRTATWTIYVVETDVAVSVTSVDAWTRVAWLYGSAEAGKDNGFEYRATTDSDWTRVPADWITTTGGSFHARLKNLQPETAYEARAYSDSDVSAVATFTTGSEQQMPNTGFDSWWLDGKVWNPWSEDGSSFWDTGNKGATTLGASNSVPTSDTYSGSGQAAMLQSKFVGIATVGKLAAGNIFSGTYVRTDGTNGILNFGREFTQRPTRLTGYMKYECAEISSVGTDSEYQSWKGRPDTANIYIALADWSAPLEVRTNPKNRQLFDPNGDGIIAYGSVQYGETIANYVKFSIELNYRSTSRVPCYILVVASASKYGDFFVGGNGSVLYIDDLKLEYDY